MSESDEGLNFLDYLKYQATTCDRDTRWTGGDYFDHKALVTTTWRLPNKKVVVVELLENYMNRSNKPYKLRNVLIKTPFFYGLLKRTVTIPVENISTEDRKFLVERASHPKDGEIYPRDVVDFNKFL
ncbi:hypothetical protein [Stenotrophomonas phage RAS14]